MADTAPYFDICPRCGTGGLEKLKTHSHCFGCNYTELNDGGSYESLLTQLQDTLTNILSPGEVLTIHSGPNKLNEEVA